MFHAVTGSRLVCYGTCFICILFLSSQGVCLLAVLLYNHRGETNVLIFQMNHMLHGNLILSLPAAISGTGCKYRFHVSAAESINHLKASPPDIRLIEHESVAPRHRRVEPSTTSAKYGDKTFHPTFPYKFPYLAQAGKRQWMINLRRNNDRQFQ